MQALVAGTLATTRVDGVETHLDVCRNCQLLVSAGVRTTSLRTHGFDRQPARPLHFDVGRVVSGRYRITRFIARGGMGEVYAAYDEMLGEEIALKVLLRSASGGTAGLARLRAEVQLARRVLNPHVLRMFDIGSSRFSDGDGDGDGEDGESLFLTMQLLEGETLRARIQRAGPLAPAEVWRLANDMFAALGAAHQLGIVHRDFKSDNVMLVPNAGGLPQAVVMDFGLAQAVATDPTSNKAEDPLVAGTVGYMAPEQLSGGAVTAAADVYAFGVVLHEMLTGVLPPFRPDIRKKGGDRPPPPTTRLDALDIPARWRSFIRRCLARDPGARFRNMSDARQAIAGRSGAKPRVAVVALTAAAAFATAAGAIPWKRAPAAPVVEATERRALSSRVLPSVDHMPVDAVTAVPVGSVRSERTLARKPRRSTGRANANAAPESARSAPEDSDTVGTLGAFERIAPPAQVIDGDEAIDPFRDSR